MVTTIYNLNITFWEKTPETLKDIINKLNLKTVIIKEVKDEYNYLVATVTAYVTTITETIRVY